MKVGVWPLKGVAELTLAVSAVLTDDVGLCGGFLTWLTSERRDWLSGRYLSVNWDVNELEGMKDEIVEKDKLKFQMVI